MLYRKIMTTSVTQYFNDAGECVSQECKEVPGFKPEYETEDGYCINEMDMPLGGREYFPLDMWQPINVTQLEKIKLQLEKSK